MPISLPSLKPQSPRLSWLKTVSVSSWKTPERNEKRVPTTSTLLRKTYMCSTTTCLPVNSTPIQLRLPLDFNICMNPDSKSIVNTVCAACEEAGLFRYIHNPNRDMYGYSSQKMLECVLLAYTLFGYASVRQLEDYCKHDIRFIDLMQGEQPSFMSFQRFISDDLTESDKDKQTVKE